jgi:SMODS-associated and fused to various effectors sensor domain
MTTQAARQLAATPSERPTKVKSRDISRAVEAMLWGRAAGRCQFDGCNRPLWKSPITQERVNLAEKAHIYSFSSDGPRGNRGVNPKRLNALENLILVCDICHKTIDRNWTSDRYTTAQLQQWKATHETRVARVGDVGPEKSSHILLFGSNIGHHQGPLHYRQAVDAVFPHWYPAEEHAIELGVRNSVLSEVKEAVFWDSARANLEADYAQVRRRIKSGEIKHLSIFALAAQPLLIRLGALLGDIVRAEVYQLHREPTPSWKWPAQAPAAPEVQIRRPPSTNGPPALLLAFSATVTADRITSVLSPDAAIWTVTVRSPHKEIVKSAAQLSEMRGLVSRVLDEIKAVHGQDTLLHVFPVMPVSLAVEFGRARSPKAEMPWRIYDQVGALGGFVPALQIDPKE